jgi:ubiquinone/menaquinone biosynthesis C-methylase UbiE
MGMVNRESNAIAIRALEISPHDAILDLGIGPGRTVETLTAMAPQGCVLGVDHSASMLAQAARHNKRPIGQRRFYLQRACFDALPYRTESIDKILAAHVVYFMNENASELREARRVLRPGGRIAIVAIDKSVMAKWKFAHSSTHRLFGLHELSILLLHGGFEMSAVAISRIYLPFGIPGLLAVATKG